MNWLILIIAGLFEVVWATALKMSNGFRNPIADIVCAVGMALSVWLLAVAMKTIPMGTAYAVWTGIGAIGGVVVGIAAFGESASETLYACNTYQFADYSRYDMTLFTEEEKRAYRDTHFATDLANAHALGKRLDAFFPFARCGGQGETNKKTLIL